MHLDGLATRLADKTGDAVVQRPHGAKPPARTARKDTPPVPDTAAAGPLVTPAEPIPRTENGRPYVVPPEGGKAKTYTRCTTYVKVLEDTYNLTRWQCRMTALGVTDRPDLQLAVAAARDDKGMLNGLCADAQDYAKAHAAATTGTALHTFTEKIDRGLPLGPVPEAYRADLDAYREETACLTMLAVEPFAVQDDLKIGGTPDRVAEYRGHVYPECRGRRYIADVKSGGGIDYGIGTIAMQLAVYARSVFYDHRTATRTPLPDVDTDWAIVVKLPAGSGTAELLWVDIARGWDAVNLATGVRKWRNVKDLAVPFTPPADPVRKLTVVEQINAAATEADLVAVWQANQAEWSDELTRQAAARKAVLTQPA